MKKGLKKRIFHNQKKALEIEQLLQSGSGSRHDPWNYSQTTDANWSIVDDLAGLEKLQREWQQLFAGNPRHTPFQSWAWTKAWIRHLAGPHRLRIICLRDDAGRLAYLLPLVARKTGNTDDVVEYSIACGYGRECSDHIGPLSVKELNDHLPDITAFVLDRFIDGDTRITLTSLDASANFPEELRARIAGSGRPVRLTEYGRCPSARLPGSWEEFLQGLSKNFRSQVGRYHRKLAQHDSAAIRAIEPEDAASFVEDLIRLNTSRIADKGEQSSLTDPAFQAFMRDAVPCLAREGLAWMDVITDGEEVVGAALNLVHADRVYYYLGGFANSHAELRPGNVLFAEVLQRSIARHCSSYDFLRGTEPYKYRWGAKDLLTWRLDVYPKGFLRGTIASRTDEMLGKWRHSLGGIRRNVIDKANGQKGS